jgi:hypothetical protein
MAVKSGHGTTLGFGTTTAWTPLYISVSGPNPTRAMLPSTHLGTTGGFHTHEVGDLVEGGELTAEFFYEPEDGYPPISAAKETITLTNPDSGAATEAFSGAVSGFEGAERVTDQLMRATLTIKVCGAITHTP